MEICKELLEFGQYLGHNVTFKSSQTPLIFDPMSTLVFGYASCTGKTHKIKWSFTKTTHSNNNIRVS